MWSKFNFFVEIVKFGKKYLNLIKILKFGQNCDVCTVCIVKCWLSADSGRSSVDSGRLSVGSGRLSGWVGKSGGRVNNVGG